MVNRKKKQKAPPSIIRKMEVTKTYFDKFSLTATKMLQILGLDPLLFNRFTKKQKLNMMHAKFDMPKVHVQKGHSVPRQYVKFIQHHMNVFLEKTLVGDVSLGLLYQDYVTMGMAFLSSIAIMNDKIHPNHTDMIALIFSKTIQYEKDNESVLIGLLKHLQSITFHISKINIRIYGFIWLGWGQTGNSLTNIFYLTATDSKSTNFSYQGITHKAFRMGIGNYIDDEPAWLTIPFNSIINTSSNTRKLNLFIQNHALLRMKERLDTLSPGNRNVELINSLNNHETIQEENGRFFIKFQHSMAGLLGYLAFTIIDDNLYILSFIPLCSPNVPEGSRLCKALNMSKDDLIFLGMDKLSFFQHIDFDAIPNLKKAVIDAGMWHLTEIEPDEKNPGRIERKTTGVIARFFQQNNPELNKEDVFDEITKLY